MSASTLPYPPRPKGARLAFWLAMILVVALGVGLAWLGAGSMRGATTASVR